MAIADEVLKPSLGVDARTRAFEAFVDSHRDDAVRLAFRLLRGDTAAAEDVAQNAFLRAHRALAGFREEAGLSTWFYRILVREVHRHRRWQSVRRLWTSNPADWPEPANESPVGDPALRRRIADALERLTVSQREAFVLVHLEGFTVTEAAATLGKAVGTLKSHLHRALDSLRRDLADLRPTDRGAAGAREGNR